MVIKIWTREELEEHERRTRAMRYKDEDNYSGYIKIPISTIDNGATVKKIKNKEEVTLASDKERMLERFRLYGVKEKPITGDGNCQFAAVADQLFGNPKHHPEVRKLAVDWLRENRDYEVGNGTTLHDFLQLDCFPTWEDYCNYLSEEGSWGDHITLIAISEIFRCTIVILSSVEIKDPSVNPITIVQPNLCEPERVVLLCHWHEQHYGSLYIDE